MAVANAIVLAPEGVSPEATQACAVRAWCGVTAPLETIPQLRRNPDGHGYLQVPANFLKQADEQSVAGFAAVLQAIHDFGLQDEDFSDWGVVAAPRFLGRLAGTKALDRFARSGGSGISPHLASQQSLHAPAGLVSIALGIHGPNFGVGGGPSALAEGLLTALTLCRQGSLPGLWLVTTEWHPEPIPDGRGGSTNPAACYAIAMSLSQAAAGWPGLTLQLSQGAQANRTRQLPDTYPQASRTRQLPGTYPQANACGSPDDACGSPDDACGSPTVSSLIDYLNGYGSGHTVGPWVYPLDWDVQRDQQSRWRQAA